MKIPIPLILFTSFVFINGCKYEDGPKLSLRSKEHRLVNTWHLNQVIYYGIDKTEQYKGYWDNYQFILKDNRTYELKFDQSNFIEKGKWSLSTDKKYVNFSPDTRLGYFKWEILKLKEKEIWVIQTRYSSVIELHLK